MQFLGNEYLTEKKNVDFKIMRKRTNLEKI